MYIAFIYFIASEAFENGPDALGKMVQAKAWIAY